MSWRRRKRHEEMFAYVGIVAKDLKRAAGLGTHMPAPPGFKIMDKHGAGPSEGRVAICGGAFILFFVIEAE